MFCAVLEAPRILKIKEKEIPKIGESDILVKIAACAICGTDEKKYHMGHKLIRSYPIVPGHEISGEIVKVGKKAREFEVKKENKKEIRRYSEGDRIVIAPVISCESCINCIQKNQNYVV